MPRISAELQKSVANQHRKYIEGSIPPESSWSELWASLILLMIWFENLVRSKSSLGESFGIQSDPSDASFYHRTLDRPEAAVVISRLSKNLINSTFDVESPNFDELLAIVGQKSEKYRKELEQIFEDLYTLESRVEKLCATNQHRFALTAAENFKRSFAETEVSNQTINYGNSSFKMQFWIEQEVDRLISQVYARIAEDFSFSEPEFNCYFYFQAAEKLLQTLFVSSRESISFEDDVNKISEYLTKAGFTEQAKRIEEELSN